MVKGLDKLAIRLKRNQQLVEQLLTLARAGSIRNHTNDHIDGNIDNTYKQVSIKTIIEQVISLIIAIKRANIESHIESIEGTGLGLSIVKSICEQAGIDVFMKAAHSIDLSRNDNQGLCVTLVF